jgi:hypothetical protein
MLMFDVQMSETRASYSGKLPVLVLASLPDLILACGHYRAVDFFPPIPAVM